MAPHPVNPIHDDTALVLFDGVCPLCNGFVQFVIARDPKGRFRFAPLQGEAARRACVAAGLDRPAGGTPDSVIVLQGGRMQVRSDAVLTIAAGLPFPWRLLAVGRMLPRPVRDALYRLVARNRYRWFGQRTTCPVPSPRVRDRFLE